MAGQIEVCDEGSVTLFGDMVVDIEPGANDLKHQSSTESVSNIKPLLENKDENKAAENESRAAQSPLFVSEGSAVSLDVEETPLHRNQIAIRVPPAERRWEYRVISQEPRVKRILKEIDTLKELRYLVEYKCGGKAELSFDQLVKSDGGSGALDRLNNLSATAQSYSSSEASSAIMVSTRQIHSRRPRDAGFVDSTNMDLSDEDELAMFKNSTPHLARKRGLLSAPNPYLRNKTSYAEGSSTDSQLTSDGSDNEAYETRQRITKRHSLRERRSTINRKIQYNDYLVEDESGSGDSLAPPSKRRRLSSQDAAGEQTRRSERVGRVSRNMRERGEDDIPEVTSSRSGAKPVGAREQFKSLPISNDFRLRHSQTCDTCSEPSDASEKGPLVFCQGCILSYHKNCLGPRNGRQHLVTKIGDKDFVLQCRRCIALAKIKDRTAPQQGKCQSCHEVGKSCKPFRDRKTSAQEQKDREENGNDDPITIVSPELLNNVDNVLFRCVGCYRAFHMHHLPPRAENGTMEGAENEHQAIARFNEYCRDWSCEQCSTAPAEIESLVAWRPIEEDTYVVGQPTHLFNEDDKEYLIKWKKLSYFRCLWMPGPWVWGVTAAAMRNAFARRDNENNLPKMRIEDAIPEDYLRIDIVLDVRYTNVVNTLIEEVEKARVKEVAEALVKFKGLGYEEAVWEEPPDSEDTERWVDFKSAYEDWVSGRHIHLPVQYNLKSHLEKVRAQKFESKIMMKNQPKTLTGGTLMPYQMEGLNWLLYQWHRGQNAILADEMGLGKTIQVIGFLASLYQFHRCWPFLIVVPNSTCANWRREIKQWAPSLRVVSYFGSAESRKLAYKYELFPGSAKDLRCHVVVTSYDAAQDESCFSVFKKVPWAGLIVDEGQRLSNDKALLYNALTRLKAPFTVLLTGTPLQNNPRELFNLLQFLDKSIVAQALEEKYATLTKENVPELHDLIRPFFLRRTKAQVLTFLPPMAQIIIPVTASTLQKELYKSILSKNSDLMKAIFGGDKRMQKTTALKNILMQLRKCLCHPFVYSRDIEEQTASPAVLHRSLVEASSKLQLLEIMLPKLQERGHRVLIFSQFLDMLDVVEDFLDGLGMLYQRLDGTISSLQKQKRIDEFNAPSSPLFAFLLSTRAGGVGINLATADTVIVLDPDYNPHRDIQAFSRAHRIGQEKKVLIFQLMTRGTAEEKIMQMGKKKMALDHVLIDQMDADEADGADLESVLRFGAEAIFKDDDTNDIHYDSASVDKLLDRSHIENTDAGKDGSAESQFSFARVWANEKGVLEDGFGTVPEQDDQIDSSVWDKILEERAREAARDAASVSEALGRGKRSRKTIDYTKQAIQASGESPSKNAFAESDSDTDFQARADESEGDESGQEDHAQLTADELRTLPANASRNKDLPDGFPLPAKTGNFRRAGVPQAPIQKASANSLPCLLCNDSHGRHAVGFCPLKIAGVEYCNLCGLAHYGSGRVCPHLDSEMQCRQMIAALKESNEPKEIKDVAKKYLRGVIGDLVQRKKKKEARTLTGHGIRQSDATARDPSDFVEASRARSFSDYGIHEAEKENMASGSFGRPEPRATGEVWEA